MAAMADSKRLSLGGRIATPRVPPSMPMEQVLARSIGANIRIQTAPPAARTLTAYVFAASPSSPVITLSSAPLPLPASAPSSSGAGASGQVTPQPVPHTSFTVLPISAIQSFTLLELGPNAAPAGGASGASTPTSPAVPSGGPVKSPVLQQSPLPPLPPLDPAAAQRRLADAVARLHAEEARRGKGVSREAQALFDALYRTLPVEWSGESIVVNSMVVVGPPYEPGNCRLLGKGGNQQALARVRKVVENEKKRLATTGNGAKGSPVGGEVKKGG